MTVEQTLLIDFVVILLSFQAVWVAGTLRKNVAVVDVFWGLGFVLITVSALLFGGNWTTKTVFVTSLVGIWGLRLSTYLAWRNWGKPEDYRYAAMRKRHGRRFPIVSLFTVFGLQALLVWIVSLPLQVGVVGTAKWNACVLPGVALWLVGFVFETVGDFQLARFKADPSLRGRVMDRGLWRYTRHPNYFGDFLVWWGFYLVSVEPSSWWWTIVGPLVMSLLLLRVSGVPLLESSLRRRVTGYEEYVRRTSPFFPRPPKK